MSQGCWWFFPVHDRFQFAHDLRVGDVHTLDAKAVVDVDLTHFFVGIAFPQLLEVHQQSSLRLGMDVSFLGSATLARAGMRACG
jgi:hypothetical protein